MGEKSGLMCNKYKEYQTLIKSNVDSKYLQIFFCLWFEEKINKKDAEELKVNYDLECFLFIKPCFKLGTNWKLKPNPLKHSVF